MKIETLEVAGFCSAIHGMRNPMDSWDKSDSSGLHIGENDKNLSIRLQKAGPEHCKHLRMVQVWADITAPRYWWNEFDTYRAGVEKVSCSTMHRLMARELTPDDFEHDCILDENIENWLTLINNSMKHYKGEMPLKQLNAEEKKNVWRGIIQALPQSYLQKRTVMMSYAALRNIYRQREGHKLVEWQYFREWVEDLPESWMITEGWDAES